MAFLRKARVAARRVGHYLRHDFREMAWPSSLPVPEGEPPPRRLSLREHGEVWAQGWGKYRDSWLPEKPKQAEPYVPHPDAGTGQGSKGPGGEAEQRSGTAQESAHQGDAGAGAAGDAAREPVWTPETRELVRSALMARLTAYASALREFLEGYREGLAEAFAPQPAPHTPGSGGPSGTQGAAEAQPGGRAEPAAAASGAGRGK